MPFHEIDIKICSCSLKIILMSISPQDIILYITIFNNLHFLPTYQGVQIKSAVLILGWLILFH
jgi:hypothetical protein